MSPRATGFAAVVNFSTGDGCLEGQDWRQTARHGFVFSAFWARTKSFRRQAAEPKSQVDQDCIAPLEVC